MVTGVRTGCEPSVAHWLNAPKRRLISQSGQCQSNCSTEDSLSTGKLVAVSSNEKRHTDTVSNPSTGRSKESTAGQSLIPHNLTRSPHSVGFYKQSVRIRMTKTWSSEGRQNGAGRHQRHDLGNCHDCVNEGSGTISEKTINNIYALRRTQNSPRRSSSLIDRMKILE